MHDDFYERPNVLNVPRSTDETARWFGAQLCAALSGKASSVRAYRTAYAPIASSASGQSALVAVADLSGLRVARAEIHSGRWKLQNIEHCAHLAALAHPTSSEEYFGCIAGCLAPYIRPKSKLGLCLPWPLETVGMSNVIRPPAGSPWHMHLNGVDPARALQLALVRTGVSKHGTIRCLAAPTAVLLAGLALPETNMRNMAALILDGGGQAAYVEQCRPGQPVIAVALDLNVLADLSPSYDDTSWQPLQDMPSLASVTLQQARSACADGRFSPAAARHIRSLKRISTESMYAWLGTKRAEPTRDEAAFQAVADQVLRRAAQRYAASAAGILHCAAQRSIDGPAFLIAHGAAYTASRTLRDYISAELHSIEPSNSVPSWCIAQVANDLLVGTACAALQRTTSAAPEKKAAANAG